MNTYYVPSTVLDTKTMSINNAKNAFLKKNVEKPSAKLENPTNNL